MTTDPVVINDAITGILKAKFQSESRPDLEEKFRQGKLGFERVLNADRVARLSEEDGPAPGEAALMANVTASEVGQVLAKTPGRAGGISGVTNDLLRVIFDENVCPQDMPEEWEVDCSRFKTGLALFLTAMLHTGYVPTDACH
jgi:hypothetical protein